ncbi:MAG: hypothetical protein NWF03_06625 [Candidatus Bathyarchaeota archaeon]|nr:hypothetical protein [Candidatus Bathyarchaeota archaeon]
MEKASYIKSTIPLKAVYVLTLGSVATLFFWALIAYYWTGITTNIFTHFVQNLDLLFFLSITPLSIFVVVFLTKGGGIKYFKSWNSPRKLQFSGITILAGYISVMLPVILSSHFKLYKFSSYTYFVLTGLSLIVVGFLVLLSTYITTASARNDPNRQKTRQNLLKICAIFASVILIGSTVCFAGAHCNLQRKYDSLAESYEFLTMAYPVVLDEQWTNTTNNDINVINCKGALANLGRQPAYNVTLLVNVFDNNNVILQRQEIPIGELNIWQYETFDVNFECSGEVARVKAGIKWD